MSDRPSDHPDQNQDLSTDHTTDQVDSQAMTAEMYPLPRNRGGSRLLALVFGIVAGVGIGKYAFKPKVSLQQFEAVKAKSQAATKSLDMTKKNLADLKADLAKKICFIDEKDPDFQRAREMVLATMGGQELESLRDAEMQKTAIYLQTNDRLWRNQSENMSERFDAEIAEMARGTYRGEWVLEFPGDKPVALQFDLTLNGFQANDKPNVIFYRDKDGTFKSTIEFRRRLLGSSTENKRLFLIIDNAFKESRDDILYYGFRFPADLKQKQKARGKILGLTPSREWKVIGEYTMRRG